jgi:hypothetical protein
MIWLGMPRRGDRRIREEEERAVPQNSSTSRQVDLFTGFARRHPVEARRV